MMTDEYLTDEHQQLRTQVRKFADEEVAPRVAQMEAAGGVDHELSRRIAHQGWIGATIPTTYGGMGAGHLAKTLIIEELSRVSGAMGAMTQASQLGVAKVVNLGTQAQKNKWLPQFADGTCLPTIAVTEHGSGGHVLGMESEAKHRKGHYVLTGSKTYVGNSHIGDVHGVVVRTGHKRKDLTALLVEADTPGLHLVPQTPALGLHGFSFGELHFDQCVVPEENMIGVRGDGLAVAYSSSVLYGRPNLTAVALGIHQAILEETTTFCAERQRYGAPLADLGPIKLKLGRMQSRLMTARLTAYHAAHLLDRGESCDAELMNAKLVGVEYALDSARNAMEIHAGAGLLTDRPIERYLRDAHHIFAPAGTSDIQRLRLAEAQLGTSKGDWSARLAETTAQPSQLAPRP